MSKKLRNMICAQCGSIGGKPGPKPGNAGITLLLFLLFILPGLIYSESRSRNRGVVCKACGAATMVPLSSPRGQELRKHYGTTSAG